MKLPRVYPILDAATVRNRGVALAAAAQALVDGGAKILQLRVKGSWTRAQFAEAQEIAGICERAKAQLIVNDRADMAALLQAGLHVGQEDLAPADARKVLAEPAVLGYSTHNAEQLERAAAEPISYAALGPLFATASKDNPDPVVGVAAFAKLRKNFQKPLVAIGGITRENAAKAWEAGADSVAVIADLFPEPCQPDLIRERMQEWQRLTPK